MSLLHRLKTGERPIKLKAIKSGKYFIVRDVKHSQPVLVGKFIGKPRDTDTEPVVKAKVRRASEVKVQEVTLGIVTDLGINEQESPRSSYFIPYDPLHPN